MSVRIVIFNALGLLDADVEREARLGVADGVAAFGRYAKVENIGIVVHPHGYVSEFTGFGGMNYGPESFAVFADSACEGIRVDTRRHGPPSPRTNSITRFEHGFTCPNACTPAQNCARGKSS